jgi:hypothetical protein
MQSGTPESISPFYVNTALKHHRHMAKYSSTYQRCVSGQISTAIVIGAIDPSLRGFHISGFNSLYQTPACL